MTSLAQSKPRAVRLFDLSRTFIRRADLSNASLVGANLSFADCTNAIFRGADFKDARLGGTILKGADLSGAKNLTPGQIASATIDDHTIFPEYLQS
jgi:uncharacterized protein YjbI with pentapeptide repeats